MRKRLLVITATVMIGAAACGGGNGDMAGHDMAGSSASSPAPAPAIAPEHNEQDVMFAQQMIPHHKQAIAMSALAATRAKSNEVKTLARQIERAQGPEIKTMTGWLGQWGQPADDMSGMPGMDHGGGGMGMMSDQDMAKLEKATGAEFDRMFLTMMIKHHEGAVAMAEEERAKGAYAPAKTMAGAIITAQNAEIAEMRRLLK